MWSGRLVTTKPVGKAHPPKRYESEPTTVGKCDTKSIRICVPQRTTKFKFHANGIIEIHRPNPQKDLPQGIVGTPIHQWLVPGNFHRELFQLKCMEERKRFQKSIRHSLPQSQINNKSNSDT